MDRLEATRLGFSDRDLFTILSVRGFRSREGGRNHTVYEHPAHQDLTVTIPRGKDLPPVYAVIVRRMFKELANRERGA